MLTENTVEKAEQNLIPIMVISPQTNGTDRIVVGLVDAQELKEATRRPQCPPITVTESRTVIWYTKTCGSLDGLGEDGPSSDCRMGKKRTATRTIYGASEIGLLNEKAWKKIQKHPAVKC